MKRKILVRRNGGNGGLPLAGGPALAYNCELEVSMSRTLTISDDLYHRLEAEARQRGLPGVEQLLEHWQMAKSRPPNRNEVVREIDDLRNRLLARYGEMPDSVEFLRQDRAR